MHGAGAAMEDPALYAIFAKNLGGAFDGVAFPKGAKIEHHPFPGEVDRELSAVEFQQVHADFGARIGQGFGRGDLPSAPHKTPTAHERGDGDVEGASGFSAQELSLFEQAENRGLLSEADKKKVDRKADRILDKKSS